MAVKNKFGIEEPISISKVPTESFIMKEENKIYRGMVNDSIVYLGNHILEIKEDVYNGLMKILKRNQRNPVEVIKEGGLDV